MVHFRSPSWLIPAASHDGFSTDVHHHGAFTKAARGGLTPAPACRCRRAYLHLHNSMVTKIICSTSDFPAPFGTHQRPGRDRERLLQGRADPRPDPPAAVEDR